MHVSKHKNYTFKPSPDNKYPSFMQTFYQAENKHNGSLKKFTLNQLYSPIIQQRSYFYT